MPIDNFSRPCLPGQFGQAPEIRPRHFRIVIPRRHGHQAREPQIRAAANRLDQRGQGFRVRAGLGFFPGKLHLDHDFKRLSPPGPAAEPVFPNRRSRSPEKYPRPCEPCSIADARSGEIRAPADQPSAGCLRLEFLHVVFAKYAQAQLVRFARHIGGKFFGDRDQRDLRARAPGAPRRVLNSLLHPFQTFTKHAVSSIRGAPIARSISL